jgi:hypothetical protein
MNQGIILSVLALLATTIARTPILLSIQSIYAFSSNATGIGRTGAPMATSEVTST